MCVSDLSALSDKALPLTVNKVPTVKAPCPMMGALVELAEGYLIQGAPRSSSGSCCNRDMMPVCHNEVLCVLVIPVGTAISYETSVGKDASSDML